MLKIRRSPGRRQAIIWTNDGKIADAYMRHFFRCVKLNNFDHDIVKITKGSSAWFDPI